jgi:peptidoglycan/xylan/chitin deacetylase (PgdA/CDA1 family)
MYHRVEEVPPDSLHSTNFVRQAQFAAQLDALLQWGFESITFDDWLGYRAGTRAIPSRPLIITFDDGYRSVRTAAWPMLRDRGFGATTFLVSGAVGGTNRWDASERQVPLLDAAEVLALGEAGMAFGSHGRTHQALGRISVDEATEELVRSRAELEELLGQPVRHLSYPYSNQSRAVRAAARSSGYVAAVRGRGHMNRRRTDPLQLRRIKVDYRMSLRRLGWTLFRERWLRI